MSWLSDLIHGNKGVNNAANSLMSTGAQATGQGMGDIGTASSFWNNILQGGGAKALAPEIGSIQKQGEQKKQTLSQFGNRSGGTAAEVASSGDATTGSINDLIASLTGSAATNIGSLGANLLNTGAQSTSAGADLSLKNKSMYAQLLEQFANGAGKGASMAAMGGG